LKIFKDRQTELTPGGTGKDIPDVPLIWFPSVSQRRRGEYTLDRRQLHVMVSSKGGKRKLYGGTRSMGFKRGSLVKHSKYGLVYIGGASNGRISLHSIKDGKRLYKNAKKEDIKFKSYNFWKMRWEI
jgi:hypothetical protein